MRVDLEYLASIFDVFLNADTAYIDLSNLEGADIELYDEDCSFSERFIFHMQISVDNELIGTRNGIAKNLKDIGIEWLLEGDWAISLSPIRLTQAGHDFASALNDKEVLKKLKTELKDAPFKVIFEGSQKLLQHYMEKKLDDLLG